MRKTDGSGVLVWSGSGKNLAWLAVATLATACSSPDIASDRAVEPLVRDSAGIRIVGNTAPRWSAEGAWRLSSEPLFWIRASDGSEENILLDPASIDVDARGRIIIADGNQAGWHEVLVYDSTGALELRTGGEGEGPGEFGQLWWASAYRGDSIVAFDMSGDRTSIFDPEGRFVRLVRTPALDTGRPVRGTYGYTAGVDAAFGDGSLLAYPFGSLDVEPGQGAGPAWYRHLLLRVSPDGAAWDTLGTFEISQQYWNGTRQEQLWFGPIAVKAVGRDELYFGRGEAFEIVRYDATGRPTAIIRRAHQPRPVDDTVREQALQWNLDMVASSPRATDEVLERIRRNFDDARFAETLPPYSHAMLDAEGRLWVEEFRWFPGIERAPGNEPGRWSVFDGDGAWLTDVETPPGFILRKVTRDRALGFFVDELGVKQVAAYGLERPET